METIGDPRQVHLGGIYAHNGMMDCPKFQISELCLGKIVDSMDFEGGKSTSRLKFVPNQHTSFHDALGQRGWDSKVNGRSSDFAIDCGAI